VLGRIDRDLVALGQDLAGEWIEFEDALDLVAPEVDPDRQFFVGRVDRETVAAQPELAAHHIHVVAFVLHVHESPDRPRAHERVALAEGEDEAAVLLRFAQTVDAGD
jgi:hypothetical protein